MPLFSVTCKLCRKLMSKNCKCIPKSTQINFLLMQFGWKGFPQHHTTSYRENSRNIFLPVGMCGGDTRVADTNANHAENLKKWNVCAPTFQRASSFQRIQICLVLCWEAKPQFRLAAGQEAWFIDSAARGCCWTQSFWIFTNLIMKPKDASSESICV
jgi:hypothetical protein